MGYERYSRGFGANNDFHAVGPFEVRQAPCLARIGWLLRGTDEVNALKRRANYSIQKWLASNKNTGAARRPTKIRRALTVG